MECPFPGMDPFIEGKSYWRDFHDRLITHISEFLEGVLGDRYAAVVNDRLYVIEHARQVCPDISVIRSSEQRTGSTAVLASTRRPDPIIVEFTEEEIREPYVEILEPKAGNRLVTAIEVLSPDNKQPGPGRDSYLRKRNEFWRGGAHLVEIDLLREGQRVLPPRAEAQAKGAATHYLVSVSRRPRCELYPMELRSPLSPVNVPLAEPDPDAFLDLQAEVAAVWRKGPFRKLVPYNRTLPGLTSEEMEWCRQRLVGVL